MTSSYILIFFAAMFTIAAICNVAHSRRLLHLCGGQAAVVGMLVGCGTTQPIGMAVVIFLFATLNSACLYRTK